MCPLAADGETPKVTVFLPTWNGGELLEEVLTGITGQETPWPFEVLAIDSSSSDDTVARLRRFGVRVIEIPQSEFNHGLTRNRAVHEARGEIVVLTVQDATPATKDWLVRLTEHFTDPDVGGVWCHQIPRPDCNPFLRDRLARWVTGEGDPIVRSVSSPEVFWNELDHVARWRTIAFDNVSSAVRRSTALELPFPERKFGEDVTWARNAILAGKKIVQEPRVAVIHSHDNSIWYEFKRVYMDHQNLNDLVGLRLVAKFREVVGFTEMSAKELAKAIWNDRELDRRTRAIWALKAIPFAFTMNLAQYLGALSNKHGHKELWRVWNKIMGHHV